MTIEETSFSIIQAQLDDIRTTFPTLITEQSTVNEPVEGLEIQSLRDDVATLAKRLEEVAESVANGVVSGGGADAEQVKEAIALIKEARNDSKADIKELREEVKENRQEVRNGRKRDEDVTAAKEELKLSKEALAAERIERKKLNEALKALRNIDVSETAQYKALKRQLIKLRQEIESGNTDVMALLAEMQGSIESSEAAVLAQQESLAALAKDEDEEDQEPNPVEIETAANVRDLINMIDAVSANQAKLAAAQSIIIELAKEADDTPDFVPVVAQLKAISDMTASVGYDVASFKNIIENVDSFDDLVGSVKAALQNTKDNQEGGTDEDDEKAQYVLQEFAVNLKSTSDDVVAANNTALATKKVGYSHGVFNPELSIQEPGEYVRFISSPSTFVGLTINPLNLASYRGLNYAYYVRNNSEAWVALSGDWAKNDTARQTANLQSEFRILINEQKFVVFQQKDGNQWLQQYQAPIPVFGALFFGAVLNAEGSEVSGITLGKLVQHTN